MHIAIAGAGLLGRLLALQLVRAGHQVEVFDPAEGPLARGAAGWTAAGMLSPLAELECADANIYILGLRSLDLWPAILASLSQPVAFARTGSLMLAHPGDEGTARRVLALLRHKAPVTPDSGPQSLDTEQLRELEPHVRTPMRAWLLPQEARIHTVQAMQAFTEEATRLGVRWHWQHSVQQVEPGRLHLSHATDPTNSTALAAASGRAQDTQDFDWVFDVRGTGVRSAAAASDAQDFSPQVRGVRGEIFWLETATPLLHRPLRLLHPRHRVYLVPRAPNLVVVGASEIESEDRSPVSLRTTVELLAAAHSVLPELAEARLVHSEANLRPALPDNLPRMTQQMGLTRINGLFRHGWLLAPVLVEHALQGFPAQAQWRPGKTASGAKTAAKTAANTTAKTLPKTTQIGAKVGAATKHIAHKSP